MSYSTASKQRVVEAFVRQVVHTFDFEEAVLWITDWPFYKADEMAVVDRYRASIDEKRSLIAAPCHVFGRNEVDDCVGLFNLVVQYFWDALFVRTEG